MNKRSRPVGPTPRKQPAGHPQKQGESHTKNGTYFKPANPPTGQHRYPLESLADYLGITLGQIGGHQPGQHKSGITALAEHLKVTPRYLQHIRNFGLTPYQADRYACRLGTHPFNIWPTWFQDAPDDLDGIGDWPDEPLNTREEIRHG